MAKLRDDPRPDGYWPNTPSQWREPSVDDCTWYATEFAFEAASKTHLSMHPVKDLRNKSSDTSGGTPVRLALSETYRLWPKSEGVTYKYGATGKTEIRRALQDGKTIVYGGDYEKLPVHYRRWTGVDTFNHAMASRDFRVSNGIEQTFLYDPLGGGPTREPYDGEWIPLDAVLKFNWGDRGGVEYVGIVQGTGATDRMIKGQVERTSNKYIDLPKGAKIYDAPSGKVVRKLGAAKRWDYFGFTSGGWWAVEGWVDNDIVVAYVKNDESYDRGEWPIEPETPDTTPELEQRIEELESALASIDEIADTALVGDIEDDIVLLGDV